MKEFFGQFARDWVAIILSLLIVLAVVFSVFAIRSNL